MNNKQKQHRSQMTTQTDLTECLSCFNKIIGGAAYFTFTTSAQV